MNAIVRPYTLLKSKTLSDGREIDQGYLIYGGKEVELTPSEYSMVPGLLKKGLDLEDASEKRAALRKERFLSSVISDSSGKSILFALRGKLTEEFSGDLVIPVGDIVSTERLRMLTKQELEDIRWNIANPEEGTYVVIDEFGRRRLFIDKTEVVRPNGSPLDPQSLALFSMLFFGAAGKRFSPYSQAFQQNWKRLTGQRELEPQVFKVKLSQLRRSLEKAGWTIPKAPTGREVKFFPYRLVPHKNLTL